MTYDNWPAESKYEMTNHWPLPPHDISLLSFIGLRLLFGFLLLELHTLKIMIPCGDKFSELINGNRYLQHNIYTTSGRRSILHVQYRDILIYRSLCIILCAIILKSSKNLCSVILYIIIIACGVFFLQCTVLHCRRY